MSLISVVIPTVSGREDIFGQVTEAYLRSDTGRHRLEMLTPVDHPAVGSAWQAGAEQARGDYIHLGNDDCVPHPGWWGPAVEACEAGFAPAPQVYGISGEPQAPPVWGTVSPDWSPVDPPHATVIPFLTRRQWDEIQPLFRGHYFSDNWIADRLRTAGWPVVLRTGYAFTHYWSQVKRGAGMGSEPVRALYDKANYALATAMLREGNWSKPWP